MESKNRIDKAPWDEDDLGVEVTVHSKDSTSINGRFRLAYIHGLETWNTGGDCMVDIIYLKDGRFLGLSDELVVLYNNEDEFYGSTAHGEALIDLIKENYVLVERETIMQGETRTVKAFRCVTHVSRTLIKQRKPATKSITEFLREKGKADSSERVKKFPYLDTEIAYDFQSKLWEVKTYWLGQITKEIAPTKVKLDNEVVSFRAIDPELGDEILLDRDTLTHLITCMAMRDQTAQEIVDRALSAYYFQALSEAQEKDNVKAFDENQKGARAKAERIIYG